MAAVETLVDLSRAPELTGTKSSQNGNLLQMLYGKELNCAKRVAIMVPDGAKSVSITLLEHLLTTCARNMRRHKIDPFTAIRITDGFRVTLNELLALHGFGICDHDSVASWIRKFNQRFRIANLNIDLAWSEHVYESLRYEIPCQQIAFGGAAPEGQTLGYGNWRGWSHFHAADMIKSGFNVNVESEFIDRDRVPLLKRELTNIHFTLDRIGRLLIEPKDAIRERLGHSPDTTDSFILALASRDKSIDAPVIQAVNGAALSARETDRILSAFED